ncbi:hypothetical protein HK098_003745 [Nowakowskiella sp. JEL0407]|nr:hypothetical protein HK098_003745 [Nowakowskiella sp. JEL0407]
MPSNNQSNTCRRETFLQHLFSRPRPSSQAVENRQRIVASSSSSSRNVTLKREVGRLVALLRGIPPSEPQEVKNLKDTIHKTFEDLNAHQ